MRPTVTDRIACSVSHSIVSPAKVPEPIEMPFGLWIPVGPRDHVLNGVQIPHGNRQFFGAGATHCKVSKMIYTALQTNVTKRRGPNHQTDMSSATV